MNASNGTTIDAEAPAPSEQGVTPSLLSLSNTVKSANRVLEKFSIGEMNAEVIATADCVWILIRRPGRGGLALRGSLILGPSRFDRLPPEPGEQVRIRISGDLGEQILTIRTGGKELDSLRATVTLTPRVPLLIPYMPRDLVPLDVSDDPTSVRGIIRAAQRGLNSGLTFFEIDKPAFGTVLYFQNLTALNSYFQATKTDPADCVAGTWPELGYLLPTKSSDGRPHPIKPGATLCVSDAIIVFRDTVADDEQESARHFLQLLGIAYKQLDLPAVEYRDWVHRSTRTLADLDKAPEATVRHYGNRYVHPYTAGEYPDVMVQMSVTEALHEWGTWTGQPPALEQEFKAGLSKFYDPKLKTLRRYLPNVGDDKDADAVDSWYLYHPLLNLGRLALDGDEASKSLFLKSLDYAIKAAHHFRYRWPVQFKITDFSIIVDVAGADGRGQTDVGGVYAWVMLQAFELVGDKRFLDEAKSAIDAAVGLRFNLNYQANLTAWGAAACVRLWRVTNDDTYLQQSYVYLASFFHNCEIWESEIELAVHYRNFLGATCLQDARYMALYECFDSYAAFENYLSDSGPDLEPAARMLIAEYCRYALDRAWFYYPDALPSEVVSPTQRDKNGHIDRSLSFPVEDLYADGQQAGQVGQEIYGAGAAFVFATRSFHDVADAPFRIYCDHFTRAIERTAVNALTLTLDGGETCSALLSIVRLARRKLPKMVVQTIDGDSVRPAKFDEDRIDFHVPASGRITLRWETGK